MKYLSAVIMLLLSLNAFAGELTEISVSGENNSASGRTVFLDAEIRIPSDRYIASNPDYFNIRLTNPAPGLKISDILYPAPEKIDFFNPVSGNTEVLEEYRGTVVLQVVLDIDPSLYTNGKEVSFTFNYQMCDDTVCYPPAEEFHVLSLSAVPPAAGTPFLQLLLYLLLAFAGGILLNLTPCVLPVLSVKALHLLKQSDMDRKKIFANSLLYSAGVLVSMLALAVVTIILKLSGEYAGFSFQNQDPLFNTFLVVLLFSFALSMIGVYSIRVPGLTRAAEVSSKSGYGGSFFSGIFAILLGVSCTAPLLAPALGFAFSLPLVWIVIFFLTAGAGLAFPFFLLGLFPKIIQKFPKPGKWMDVFKAVLAFGLLIFAVDRLAILFRLTGSVRPYLFYLLAVGASLWQYGRFGSPLYRLTVNIISLVLTLTVLVGGFILVAETADEKAPENLITSGTSQGPWQNFSPDILEDYLKQGKPVFIDFTADWCLNCQINKRLVLRTSEIETLFASRGVRLIVADFTAKNPNIASMLDSYGKAGVPVYAFYPPGNRKPVFLPELITKKMIYGLLDEYFPE